MNHPEYLGSAVEQNHSETLRPVFQAEFSVDTTGRTSYTFTLLCEILSAEEELIRLLTEVDQGKLADEGGNV